MFQSLSRGRANYKSTYICTSCLAYLLPPTSPLTAHQNHRREPFSTASIHREADDKKTTKIQGISQKRTRRKPRLRRSKALGRLPSESTVHSTDTLAALKASLLAEETASHIANPGPAWKSKSELKPHIKKASSEATLAEQTPAAKAGKASADIENKAKAKAKPESRKAKLIKEPPGVFSFVRGGKTFMNVDQKKAKEKKAHPKKATIAVTKVSKTKADIPSAKTKVSLAESTDKPVKPAKKPKAKQLTDAQREQVDAVLLRARSKRSAALSKKITSQIRALGENETREALVKIIEDGALPGTLAPISIQRVLNRLRVRKYKSTYHSPTATMRTMRMDSLARKLNEPMIRPVFGKHPPPPTATQSLKEALEANRNKASPGRSFVARDSSPAHSRVSKRQTSNKSPSKITGPLIGKKGFDIENLDAADLALTPIINSQPPVPNLAYGLDRVLFNPGVYHLQDPRSRVFNFDPYLQTIMPVEEFDFSALKRYITSSRDEALLAAAKDEGKKYTGSTSSMTAALAHFHFLLSQWRPINTAQLSQKFPVEYETFTALQRGPSAIFLRWKDGIYAIDADKQFDTANILSTLGKSMEKLLTLPTEEFEKYRKENSDQISEEEREAAEPYNYTTMGDFLMRSQLDAYDPRLPGTGMFDLKTRAVISIRMDVTNYERGRDYEILDRFGEYESFEREYYDMIRSAFLKYSLQVRMGRMDGIFVAFHNTKRIFGFQYISLPEMDLALHGSNNTTIGDAEFKLSLELLNKVLDKASAKYPEKSLRMHFETRKTDVPFMYIFAEPMEDEQIQEIQESNKDAIDEFENRVLGLSSEDAEEQAKKLEEEKRAAEWSSMRAKVEETMEKDELDLAEARELAESMIDDSDIFGSETLSAEEKERLINELLESSAFNNMGDETTGSREDQASEEDGVEGASADSEGDDVEEYDEGDELDEEEENEENEESEDEDEDAVEDEDEGESNVEEQEEQEEHLRGEEGTVAEARDIESIKQVEDNDLMVDEAPTDDFAEVSKDDITIKTDIETVDAPAADNDLMVDEAPTDDFTEESKNNITEEPDIGKLDVPAQAPKSVESKGGITGAKQDEDDITDASSVQPEIVENKELAPGDDTVESDSRNTETSDESSEETKTDSSTETSNSTPTDAEEPANNLFQIPKQPEIMAMTLTIRNKVNGEYVARPENLSSGDQWTIEYALEDVAPNRSKLLYQACKTRRAKTLFKEKKDEGDNWNASFLANLRNLSKKGKQWRESRDKADSEHPVKVLDVKSMKADQNACVEKQEGSGKGQEKE